MILNDNILIITEDRISYNAEQIMRLVPPSVFSTNIHIETCLLFGSDKYPDDLHRQKVYTNLLVRRSTILRTLTAIQIIIEKNLLKIESLQLPDFIIRVMGERIKYSAKGVDMSVIPLIDNPSNLRLAAKYVYHRFYRLLTPFLKLRRIKNGSIVRCFVEVTEKIHKDRLGKSLCLFFPFPYKLKRQIDFYKSCRKKGYETAFFGVPYSFVALVKILINRTDERLVNFEYLAHLKHAKELSSLNLKNYYTEDDYDASTFVIAEVLKSTNCNVVNTAHGVNQTCPFVDCSVFEVLTRPQLNFYKYWNSDRKIEYRFQKHNVEKSESIIGTDNEICFILMHSNYEDFDTKNECDLQNKIIKVLEESRNKTDRDIRIKFHPNTKDRLICTLAAINSVEEIRDLRKIKVFITINSTSYFTYFNYGLFLFIGDDIINPFNIIDPDVPFYKIENLEHVINDYSSKERVIQSLNKQYNLLKGF